MIYNDNLFYLLEEIALETNYEIKGFSDNYIIQIKDKNTKKQFCIFGNAFPLNNNSSQKICADKSAFFSVMNDNNIPCVEHTLYKHPKFKYNWHFFELEKKLKEYKKVVLKDNRGFCGIDVHFVDNKRKLKRALSSLIKHDKDIALSPFINYENEYRVIMLNGACKVCYKKVRPFVIGNGTSTTKTLAKEKYPDLNFEIDKKLKKYIPNKDEKITIGWKHNLKMNSTPETLTNTSLKKGLVSLAKKATNILNLKFCSVDIIECSDGLKILETNSIVSMGKFASQNKKNYNITKNIFKEAIQESFKSLEK